MSKMSKAQCRQCDLVVSRGRNPRNLTTSNLRAHLRMRHGVHFDTDISSSSGDQRQPSIQESFRRRERWDANHPKAKKITQLIAECIAVDDLPLRLVEKIGFRRLMAEVAPNYEMPSRKTISTKIIPQIYKEVKLRISEKLAAVNEISLTTDAWTSVQNFSYLGVTAHFVPEGESELFSTVISIENLRESQTAINIKECLFGILTKWDIEHDKLKFIVTDNGANITSAIRLMEITNLRCLAHTMNLIVKQGVSLRHVQRTISTARNIVSHFNRSAPDAAKLVDVQKELGLPEHKLKQDVITRWNSTFEMVARICEQKRAINHISTESNVGGNLTFRQWQTSEALVKLLRPFDIVTKEMSLESATISNVIPMFVNLINIFVDFKEDQDIADCGLISFVETILDGLRKRFKVPQTSTNESYFYDCHIFLECAKATILDPRFKLSPFKANIPENRELFEAIADVKLQLISDLRAISSPSEEVVETMVDAPSTSTSSVLFRSSTNVNHSTTVDLESQLENYLSEPCVFNSQNRQNYSASHSRLFALSKKYSTCPPTSVPSERLFSVAGHIISPRRSLLKPYKAEMLTFLKYNLVALKFEY